jgi:uncharacterized phage protein (TIGR02218 family)
LAQPQFRAEDIVALVRDESHIQVSGIGSMGDGFFRFGELAFLDGVAEGQGGIAESYSDTEGEVTLWLPLTVTPEVGDRVRLTAGCDKAFSTCRTKFSNHLNFQGFPHIPGADFAYTYADGGTVHDGSALFK